MPGGGLAEATQAAFDVGAPEIAGETALAEIGAVSAAVLASPAPEAMTHPLGAACAQVHDTYIVAQTA